MTIATKTEKPILFSTELVQAILDGRKTQTRRVITKMDWIHKDEFVHVENPNDEGVTEIWWDVQSGPPYGVDQEYRYINCPYHADELWVRETHAYVPKTAFQASVGVQQVVNPDDDYEAAIYKASFDRSQGGIKWRPSIHMHRWASRIQLTVEDIRVERVQDISTEDAIAEGVEVERRESMIQSPKNVFADLWDKINADRGYSWESNPWVWVVEFSIKNIKG